LKIVHLTDLHYYRPAGAGRLLGKRFLAAVNLSLGGRSRAFGGASRDGLVDDVLQQQPDLVVITGDLTAQATHEEFEAAQEALRPLLSSFPTVILAGNHDRYTHGSTRTRRMESYFGAHMDGGAFEGDAWLPDDVLLPPAAFHAGETTVLCLDTARPDWVSRGRVERDQLQRLEAMLCGVDLKDRLVLLALHYPPLTPQGEPYTHPTHGLVGVESLLESLRRCPVDAVLHGHDHHWHVTSLQADGAVVPVLNGGSSGHAPGEGRAPGYFILESRGKALQHVTRRAFVDDGYRDEAVELP